MLLKPNTNISLVSYDANLHTPHYDIRKYYFTNIVVLVWNSLPNDVVLADNINLFKKCLDKF